MAASTCSPAATGQRKRCQALQFLQKAFVAERCALSPSWVLFVCRGTQFFLLPWWVFSYLRLPNRKTTCWLDAFVLLSDDSIMATDGPTNLQRPIVLSSLSKTTVVKRSEDFSDLEGKADLVIFGCHDCYIYVLGPIRYPFLWLDDLFCFLVFLSLEFLLNLCCTHVMVTASSNCHILTAPNTGIFHMDRCEGVHVTAVSGIIRVRWVSSW